MHWHIRGDRITVGIELNIWTRRNFRVLTQGFVHSLQVAKEVAQQLQGITQRITVFDRKRKQDLALKLQQRWQRCEISNFDYLMQAWPPILQLGAEQY